LKTAFTGLGDRVNADLAGSNTPYSDQLSEKSAQALDAMVANQVVCRFDVNQRVDR
jgi:hypothetical protein